MILQLKRLRQEPGGRIEIRYQIGAETLSQWTALAFGTPIAVEGFAANTAGVITVHYTAETTLRQCCDRCLEEFERVYRFSFSHTVPEPGQADAGQDDAIEADGDRLDLDEVICSDVLLELPAKTLCKEDCLGLCSGCGENLNLGACRCKTANN